MIIKGVAASLPSRVVTNDDIIEMIREESTQYDGDLDKLLRIIRRFLHQSGLEERRWCERHESPIDHVAKATRAVLDESYLRRQHIELLIYVGVGRGFLEPGNSHMLADALGFHNAQCFDVVDACMSWVRALHLIDSLFKNGTYKNALLINAEFNIGQQHEQARHSANIKHQDELLYTFPMFTIGEAASATLLLPDEPDNFDFYFSSRPDLSELATIPLEGYQGFCHPTDKIAKRGANRFTSFGIDLHSHAHAEAVNVFQKMSDRKNIDKVFVHASSKSEWTKFGQHIGIEEKIHHVFQKTGNIVSASIPVALADALASGDVKRNDEIVFWVGSAGMSFNATKLRL